MNRRNSKQPPISRNELDDFASMIVAQEQGKSKSKSKPPKNNSNFKILKSFKCEYLLRALIVAICIGITPLIYLIYERMGLGNFSPNHAELSDLTPMLPESALEIVAELPLPPGNLAVSSKGRVFFNFHPEFDLQGTKVAELDPGTGSWRAFPSERLGLGEKK